jgi:hypothetical protein
MSDENDVNLVAHWLKFQPIQWVFGGISGLIASGSAMALAMWFCTQADLEQWFAPKLFATILLGYSATQINTGLETARLGFMLFAAVGIFWGMVYAHFVYSRSFFPHMMMGLVWAFLSWVFSWNLFAQSFWTIQAADIPSGIGLFVCIMYGVTLGKCSYLFKRFILKA